MRHLASYIRPRDQLNASPPRTYEEGDVENDETPLRQTQRHIGELKDALAGHRTSPACCPPSDLASVAHTASAESGYCLVHSPKQL